MSSSSSTSSAGGIDIFVALGDYAYTTAFGNEDNLDFRIESDVCIDAYTYDGTTLVAADNFYLRSTNKSSWTSYASPISDAWHVAANSNIWLIGGRSELHVSSDDGLSFSHVDDAKFNTYNIAGIRTLEDEIYILVDEGTDWSLYKTSDGVTFDTLTTPAYGGGDQYRDRHLAISDNVICMVSDNGNKIYYSEDKGSSWTQSTAPTFPATADIFSDNIGNFYSIGNTDRIYKSLDHGKTFSEAYEVTLDNNIAWGGAADGDGNVYVVGRPSGGSPFSDYYLAISDDFGDTWSELKLPDYVNDDVPFVDLFVDWLGYDGGISSSSPNSTSTSSESGLSESSSSSNTPSSLSSSSNTPTSSNSESSFSDTIYCVIGTKDYGIFALNSNLTALDQVDPDQHWYWDADYDGTRYNAVINNELKIAQSTDGNTWTHLDLSSTSPDITAFRGIVHDNNDSGVWVAVGYGSPSGNDIFRSTDGQNFSKVTTTMTNPISVTYMDGYFYTLTRDGDVYRSSDGNTWTFRSAPYNQDDFDHRIYAAGNTILVSGGSVGTDQQVRRSDDLGLTWSDTGLNFVDDITSDGHGVWYAVSSDSVYKSTDDGVSFSKIKDFNDVSLSINRIDTDYEGGNVVVTGMSRTGSYPTNWTRTLFVAVSTNSGGSWTEFSRNLGNETTISSFDGGFVTFADATQGIDFSTSSSDSSKSSTS